MPQTTSWFSGAGTESTTPRTCWTAGRSAGGTASMLRTTSSPRHVAPDAAPILRTIGLIRTRKTPSHRTNEGWSNYHSMQLTATKRVSTGLSFLVAYTFSKNLASTDDALGYYGGYGQSIYNRRADYSVSHLNVPNNLRITWIYDLPF